MLPEKAKPAARQGQKAAGLSPSRHRDGRATEWMLMLQQVGRPFSFLLKDKQKGGVGNAHRASWR